MGSRLLLVDANVLLGLTDLNLQGRRGTEPALRRAIAAGFIPRCLNAQLRETYVVLTRLAGNGYQVPPALAAKAVQDLAELVPVVPEPETALTLWTEMVARRERQGVRAHDVWIEAVARALGATILTDDRALTASAEVPTLGIEE